MTAPLGFALLSLTSILAAASPQGVKEREKNGRPHLRSESVIVRWADTKEVLLTKNERTVRPIASVTKLVSALVLAKLDPAPDTWLTIGEDDKDKLKWSKSRIKVGRAYKPQSLFEAALGASDNRAMYASVRARGVPRDEFVTKMNALAAELGMSSSHFEDPAGINPKNVSTAVDLLALVDAAAGNETIRAATQLPKIELVDEKDHALTLHNPNRLVASSAWDVVVGKTGYTIEAGRALVLRTRLRGRPLDMVFLGAHEMRSVFGDAARVRRWVEERMPKEEPLLAGTSTKAADVAVAKGTTSTAAGGAVASKASVLLRETAVTPSTGVPEATPGNGVPLR